jgi:Reverse transcriptase (RNA-dependent DNA polymerase)
VVKDYSHLNTTNLDEVCVPRCEQELIDIIGNDKQYYCLIYLIQGYHHIPLKISDRGKPLLTLGDLEGKLQYCVLPFGFKHSGQFFQCMIKKILGTLVNRCCLVYVDNILIFGESIEILLGCFHAVVERISSESGSIGFGLSKFLGGGN